MDIRPPYGYQEIVPLTKTHKVLMPEEKKLPIVFRSMNAMPLSFAEFALSARDYPIVFISGDEGKSFIAMSILGLENQQNLFVTDDQTWEAGIYIPAYIRRYPFCMTRVSVDGKEQAERIACVEKRAVSDKGESLFDDKGEPLPGWAERQRLLFEFESDLARTEEMCKLLKDLDLLEPFAVQAVPTGGQPLAMTGMYRVAEPKLLELPADKLKELVQNGVLPRVYLHLASLANFQRLLDRRANAQAKAPAAEAATTGKSGRGKNA